MPADAAEARKPQADAARRCICLGDAHLEHCDRQIRRYRALPHTNFDRGRLSEEQLAKICPQSAIGRVCRFQILGIPGVPFSRSKGHFRALLFFSYKSIISRYFAGHHPRRCPKPVLEPHISSLPPNFRARQGRCAGAIGKGCQTWRQPSS